MANKGHIIIGSKWRGVPQPAPKTAREWLERKLDARPETAGMQRAKVATRDEKAFAGIDQMTKDLKDSAERAGSEQTYDETRREVVKIAERCVKKGLVK